MADSVRKQIIDICMTQAQIGVSGPLCATQLLRTAQLNPEDYKTVGACILWPVEPEDPASPGGQQGDHYESKLHLRFIIIGAQIGSASLVQATDPQIVHITKRMAAAYTILNGADPALATWMNELHTEWLYESEEVPVAHAVLPFVVDYQRRRDDPTLVN